MSSKTSTEHGNALSDKDPSFINPTVGIDLMSVLSQPALQWPQPRIISVPSLQPSPQGQRLFHQLLLPQYRRFAELHHQSLSTLDDMGLAPDSTPLQLVMAVIRAILQSWDRHVAHSEYIQSFLKHAIDAFQYQHLTQVDWRAWCQMLAKVGIAQQDPQASKENMRIVFEQARHRLALGLAAFESDDPLLGMSILHWKIITIEQAEGQFQFDVSSGVGRSEPLIVLQTCRRQRRRLFPPQAAWNCIETIIRESRTRPDRYYQPIPAGVLRGRSNDEAAEQAEVKYMLTLAARHRGVRSEERLELIRIDAEQWLNHTTSARTFDEKSNMFHRSPRPIEIALQLQLLWIGIAAQVVNLHHSRMETISIEHRRTRQVLQFTYPLDAMRLETLRYPGNPHLQDAIANADEGKTTRHHHNPQRSLREREAGSLVSSPADSDQDNRDGKQGCQDRG